MQDFFFYLFASLTILAALMVVVNRNAVNSAMCLIVAFLGTAAMFALLEAFFLAVLQVVIYAGAIVVLFLFIIMLIDPRTDRKGHFHWLSLTAAVVALALLILGTGHLFLTSGELPALTAEPVVAVSAEVENGLGFGTAARAYGYGLFTKYMLPFQVTGFLLLIAMIGVIVLSRRLAADTPTSEELTADNGGQTE